MNLLRIAVVAAGAIYLYFAARLPARFWMREFGEQEWRIAWVWGALLAAAATAALALLVGGLIALGMWVAE